LSDSDQNERDRLPWWLKPLAGGRDAKKENETETSSDSAEAEQEQTAAADTPVPEADSSPDSDSSDAMTARSEDDSDSGSGGDSSQEKSGRSGRGRGSRRGRSRRSLWSKDDSDEDSESGSDPSAEVEEYAPQDTAPEREEEAVFAESSEETADDAEEDDEASAADSSDDEDAPASSGRSRGRRRGKRGGKKRNGSSGRTRVESTTHELSLAAIEPVIEIMPVPERTISVNDERKLGIFCDFENIALGVRDSEIKRFDITIVLERLLEKGKIIVKKAYADWERYSDYKRKFHESAIELIDIPQKYYSGKNSADIKMVVDAMEVSYTKDHLDTIVLMSGDSDFSPLVSKLKENNKTVIGVGVKNSSSNLLVDNCDEFIYYEDIWRDLKKGSVAVKGGKGKNVKSTEAFNLLMTSMKALMRDNKDVLWGSMIKQTMQRKKPSFNEGYYGYSTFSELLEDAERQKLVKLKKDQRSGTYIVTGFAGER